MHPERNGAMHINVNISMYNDDDKDSLGFGRGIVCLLENIEQSGSINKAAKNMGMAYSKAWKILTRTEKEFGFTILVRNGHQGSVLTPKALEFIDCYKKMLEEAKRAAEQVFQSCFK